MSLSEGGSARVVEPWKQEIKLPMDESQLVDGFNGQNTFRHVELCHILGKGIVFDQPVPKCQDRLASFRHKSNVHGHQIPSRQELHNEVQVIRILERIKQLNDPVGV